jgi:hypothetical protein
MEYIMDLRIENIMEFRIEINSSKIVEEFISSREIVLKLVMTRFKNGRS